MRLPTPLPVPSPPLALAAAAIVLAVLLVLGGWLPAVLALAPLLVTGPLWHRRAAHDRMLQERLQASELALEEARGRFALVEQGIHDGLWEWDVDRARLRYSARWSTLLGGEPVAVAAAADHWLSRVHKDDRGRLDERLERIFGGSCEVLECEHRLRHQDGSYRWMFVRAVAQRDPRGRTLRLAGSLTDISRGTFFDALTGLPNRSLLTNRIANLLNQRPEPGRSTAAVLFMDLNRFKVINDSLGHHVGDLLLMELAKRLQLCVRSGDTVARLGGDEFVILLEGIRSPEIIGQILDRIERYTTSAYELAGHHVFTSPSIGVVCDLHRYTSVDDVLRDADIAMYQAKGGDRPHVFFDQSMYEQVASRQRMEMELRCALERGELHLLYQPIVALPSKEIIGFEALVRWQHPSRGLVQPQDFIYLAEETGLILPIGEWILTEACRQMSEWEGDEELVIHVNLSSKQLTQPGMAARVGDILQRTGLNPERLKLEVTESAILANIELATAALTDLKRLGVKIAVDDFGTGYSSLRYIQDLPIDTIKIDRSFVRRMNSEPKSLEIVRTVMGLAQNLDLQVVPEGVELVEQVLMLQDLECVYAQGYYFSRPVDLLEAKCLRFGSAAIESVG